MRYCDGTTDRRKSESPGLGAMMALKVADAYSSARPVVSSSCRQQAALESGWRVGGLVHGGPRPLTGGAGA
jgi:hypothetical protein